MSQDLDQQVRKAMADFCRQAPGRYPVISVVIVGIILVLIIWFIPPWQVPEKGLALKDRLHQINENRKTVAQIVGGVFILVGLYIAWVRSKAMRDQTEIDREQQLTDLYVKAIEQLGSEKLQIRLGGIYALERIARESPKDHWTIMEVLTAFVRENAPLRGEAPAAKAKKEETTAALETPEEDSPLTGPPTSPEKPPTDIQAVLTVLGRTAITYEQKGEKRSLDLRATYLVGADLIQANLQGARLQRANLQGADLFAANLQGGHLIEAQLQEARLEGANLQGALIRRSNLQRASLRRANLQKVSLREANLQMAVLEGANLKGARLWDANLQGASFGEANLIEARIVGANLQGALLGGANLQGASLKEAILKGADLWWVEGLTDEQVAEAVWDETTRWPEGFSPPPPQ